MHNSNHSKASSRKGKGKKGGTKQTVHEKSFSVRSICLTPNCFLWWFVSCLVREKKKKKKKKKKIIIQLQETV